MNELRRQNASSWETTKYHLKLAKTNTSLRNIEQLTLVTNSDSNDKDDDDVNDDPFKKNGSGIKYSQSETQFIENVS